MRFIQPTEKGSGQLREVGNLLLNGLNGLMARLEDALPRPELAQKLLFTGREMLALPLFRSSSKWPFP